MQLRQIINSKTQKDQSPKRPFWGVGSRGRHCACTPLSPVPRSARCQGAWAREPVTCSCSCCSGSPSKALPAFLSCPLINSYSVIHWWTPRLFPLWPIMNDAAMNAGVHLPQDIISFPLDIYSEVKLLDNSIYNFLDGPPYWFPQWLNQFTLRKDSLFSTS